MTTQHTTPPLVATGDVLAQVRALLGAVDHDARTGLDADARLALAEEVIAVGRQLDALRAVLVAEADRARSPGPRGTGVTDLLATSAHVTSSEAAGWLFAGKEISGRPAVKAAALSGQVSVGQARAIDRVLGEMPATLTPESRDRAEQLLLERATRMDAKELAKQTRAVLAEVAPEVDGVEDEMSRLDIQRKQAVAARSFTMVADGQGSIILKGQLPVLEGEMLVNLVNAHTLSNRRALERADDRHDDPGQRSREQRTADGLIALLYSVQRGQVAGAGTPTRPTVVVTLSMDLLASHQEQAGLLASGRDLTAGQLRRLLCDSNVLPVVLGGASEPLDVGRRQRLVTLGIRRALEARDRGCAFPSCQKPASDCEAHHITPWWAGGATSLENLVLLCPHHHGAVEPLRFWPGVEPPSRWSVRMGDDGHPEFLAPARAGQSRAPEPRRNRRTVTAIEDGLRDARSAVLCDGPRDGPDVGDPPRTLPLE